MRCPACAADVQLTKLRQVPRCVRRATDFREVYSDSAPWYEYQVHLCELCGFAGTEQLYRECSGPNFGLAAVLESELGWNLEYAKRSPVERYYHAVHVAKLIDETELVIGHIALTGAWCAMAAGDSESEVYFRREAVDAYANALDEFDLVPREERAGLAYMIGELWRRVGEPDLANHWFRSVEIECATADQKDEQSWLRLAKQQATDPQEWM